MPKLVALLSNADLNDDERSQTLNIILEKITDQEEKLSSISHGIVAAIVSGLETTWFNKPYIASLAARVLGSAAKVLSGRAAIDKALGVIVLRDMLKHDDVGVREAAGAALNTIAVFRDGVNMIVKNDENICMIVAAIFDNISNDTSFHGSCNVVTEIATLCCSLSRLQKGIDAGVKNGMVKKLISALEPRNVGIQPDKGIFILFKDTKLIK